jgi:uncharacterized membrane protein YfhO
MKLPSFVVLSEINYPGWEATVDGHTAPLVTGDYALRAVAVPEGRHSIKFQFRSQTFRWGLIVGALAWVGAGIGLWATRK